MSKLSIIIPTLNEEKNLSVQQCFLSNLLQEGHEIIIVDGGSADKTNSFADKFGFKSTVTKASRGHQLRTGAQMSSHETLLFLHADTYLPVDSINLIQESLSNSNKSWGRFNIKFNNKKIIYRVIAFFMNRRSCVTSMVTGDHAMFMRKDTYIKCGGFSDLPIMEDIDISKRLKKISGLICLKSEVVTSSRKWEQEGIIKTIFKMWLLRLFYFFRISPEKLVKLY